VSNFLVIFKTVWQRVELNTPFLVCYGVQSWGPSQMVSSTASSVLLEDHKWFLVLDRRGHRKIASCYHWAVQWSTSTSVGRALWALLPRYYHGTVDDKPAEVIRTLHLQHHTSPTAPATGAVPSAQSILCLTYNLRLVYFGYPVVPLYNRPML
jgi:hypothetical protein